MILFWKTKDALDQPKKFDQQGVIYYKLFKLGETITRNRYRMQFIKLKRASEKQRPQSVEGHDKVILQHIAKPVKQYLETL